MHAVTVGPSFREEMRELAPAVTGRLEGMGNRQGKRPPKGAGLGAVPNRSIILKKKNESVAGRNNFHRA